MPAMPNPWIPDSATVSSPVTDTAAAAPSEPVPHAAAGQFDESSIAMEDIREAPAVHMEPAATAGATDDIHEIFHRARLLIAEDNAVHHRFVLDEARFVEDIEPPPLFLQRIA